MRRHVLISCIAIVVCAFALTLGGALFLIDKVPRLAVAERAACARVYRSHAVALAADPTLSTYKGERLKGWRERGRLPVRGGSVAWGHAPDDGDVMVWVSTRTVPDSAAPKTRQKAAAADVWARRVAREEEAGFAQALAVGGPILLAFFFLVAVGATAYVLRLERARSDFLAATVHDLTTPLAGMRLALAVGNVDDALVLAERMGRLVRNLRDFQRLASTRPAPEPSEFPIGEAFDEAYRLFAADYEDAKSGPVVLSGDASLVVFADRTLVVQILWNLLGNDLKYAASYGAVSVRFAVEGAFVRIDFADCGPGMSPRERRRAFDRYYRAKTVRTSGKGGFGIGLCTARAFARAQGGSLSVAANEPHGCVFTLRLPRSPRISPAGVALARPIGL